MTNVAITGAAGRMGGALIRLIQDGTVPGLVLKGALDRPDHPQLGQELGDGIVLQSAPAQLSDIDVLIDFSFHTVTPSVMDWAAANGVAVVVGTTGLTDEEQQHVEDAAKSVAVMQAPNMSLGMNLLFVLVEEAARGLKNRGYDCEIIERHHRLKKDSPSGTAIGLGEAAAAGLDWDLNEVAVDGRTGIPGERPEKEIGFHAVRGGDIVGDHTVLFAADGECVELSHRATTRDTFAVGALKGADWLAGKDAGLYNMRDVLGL